MSRVCPKDAKPCCDDLCHSAGCIDMDGDEMIEICDRCRQELDDCACDRPYEWTYEEDDE